MVAVVGELASVSLLSAVIARLERGGGRSPLAGGKIKIYVTE